MELPVALPRTSDRLPCKAMRPRPSRSPETAPNGLHLNQLPDDSVPAYQRLRVNVLKHEKLTTGAAVLPLATACMVLVRALALGHHTFHGTI